ncbi:barstar family protein [Streptomyces flavofungini]|uniref:barstar family protein n=1 Tax=Streptomyces flavofungini TaxID=68200 RepID=UPI0034DF946D
MPHRFRPALTGTSAPWVYFVPAGTAGVRQELTELRAKGGQVHHFAAESLLTRRSVHETFARTLRFPDYYGHNWDALVDCLDDLCEEVTGGVGIVGVVRDTGAALLAADHFPLFVSVLCQGADRANASADLDGFPQARPATAQHFVFESTVSAGPAGSAPGDWAGEQERIARRVAEEPGLVVTSGDGFVAAQLDPSIWR